MSAGISISEAAATLGLSSDTLRYYERDDLLLRPVPRSSSGHRRYDEADLRWVEMLTRLRATGMPIRKVRRYAELVRSGPGNEAERLALLQTHRARVQAQLVEVNAHLRAIDDKVAGYQDAVSRVQQSA